MKLAFIAYANAKFFTSNNIGDDQNDCSSTKQVSNDVASLSPIDNIGHQNKLVTISFSQQPFESNCSSPQKRMTKRKLSFECVFWDVATRIWNNSGCSYSSVINNPTLSQTHFCHCNHTTNFALLMIVDDYPFCDWCDQTLQYLTLIFVILSIIGLSVTIIYDLCIKFLPKTKEEQPVRVPRTDSEIRNHMSRELMNVITTWFFSLLILDCCYLAFSFYEFSVEPDKLPITKQDMCITIGVLLHFFLLNSFCLALSISFLQYYLYFKSFRLLKCIYLKAIIFSLLLPVLAVTVVLSINKKAYINKNKYCWLNSTYSIYSVIIPISIILVINLTFFGLIFVNNYKMYRQRKKIFPMLKYPFDKKTNLKEDLKKFILKISLMLSCFYYEWSVRQNKYRVRSSKEECIYKKGLTKETKLIITSLLNSSITWLFGFLVTIPGDSNWIYLKFVYAILFCLFNASLGLQVFVVYILITKSRREILKNKMGSIKRIQVKEVKF